MRGAIQLSVHLGVLGKEPPPDEGPHALHGHEEVIDAVDLSRTRRARGVRDRPRKVLWKEGHEGTQQLGLVQAAGTGHDQGRRDFNLDLRTLQALRAPALDRLQLGSGLLLLHGAATREYAATKT